MKSMRDCTECGMSFFAPPSSAKLTCSKPCSSKRKSRTHVGKRNAWNDASKTKLSLKGQTQNLTKGTASAKQSQIAGPFETNQEAKTWWLISPSGAKFKVRNLAKFIRDNHGLFDGSVEQAHAGLRQVQLSLMGKTKRSVSQWKGWSLVRPAEQ